MFPVLIATNLVFVLIWMLKGKKYVWISLITLGLGYSQITRIIQLSVDHDSEDNTEVDFKLLSYNVRLFDLYNWKNDQNKVTRNKIFDFLNEEEADVVTLQEFYVDDSNYFVTLDTLVQLQRAKNYHIEYTSSLRETSHWGIATFSKFPIVNRGKIEFEEGSNNICIYTDVKIDKDTIRIYNAHLASIHFDYEEYELLQKVEPGDNSKKGTRDSSGPRGTAEQIKNLSDEGVTYYKVVLQIINRLKIAFMKRADQSQLIRQHIANSAYPIILVGDFNDTPNSYAYQQITSNLLDAFRESGSGMGQNKLGLTYDAK